MVPGEGGIYGKQPHKGFYGDRIKTFSHRVNNRSKQERGAVGVGKKNLLGEDWTARELMRLRARERGCPGGLGGQKTRAP